MGSKKRRPDFAKYMNALEWASHGSTHDILTLINMSEELLVYIASLEADMLLLKESIKHGTPRLNLPVTTAATAASWAEVKFKPSKKTKRKKK